MDKITTAIELGQQLRALRKEHRIRTVQLSKASGRSRDVLHRLERGDDVYLSSLFDALRALGYAIRLERRGLPTFEEMKAWTARELEGDDVQ